MKSKNFEFPYFYLKFKALIGLKILISFSIKSCCYFNWIFSKGEIRYYYYSYKIFSSFFSITSKVSGSITEAKISYSMLLRCNFLPLKSVVFKFLISDYFSVWVVFFYYINVFVILGFSSSWSKCSFFKKSNLF